MPSFGRELARKDSASAHLLCQSPAAPGKSLIAGFRLVFLGLFLSSCGWQGVQQQRVAVGLGGRAVAITHDPLNTALLWAASPTGGLFASGSSGATWQHVDAIPECGCFAVRHWPGDPRVVLASFLEDTKTTNGGGLWRSEDNGATWSRPATAIATTHGLPRRYSAYGIAFRPSSSTVAVGTDSGFVISDDLGATWRFVDPHPTGTANRIYSLALLHSGKILAYGDEGLWISDDGKTNWYQPSPTFAGGGALDQVLAVSPYDPDVLFFTNDFAQLMLSTDGGHTWSPMAMPYPTPKYGQRQPFVKTCLARDAQPDRFDLYCSQNGWLSRKTVLLTPSGMDFSKPWQVLTTQHMDTSDIDFLPFGVPVYATDDGGVEATHDAGNTWRMVGTGTSGFDAFQVYDLRVVRARFEPSNEIYFGTQDNSLYGSRDNGSTWPAILAPEGGNIQAPDDRSEDYGLSFMRVTPDPDYEHSHPQYVGPASDKFYSGPFKLTPQGVYHLWGSVYAAFVENPHVEGLTLYVSGDGCQTWNSMDDVTIEHLVRMHSTPVGSGRTASLIVPYEEGGEIGLVRVDNVFNGIASDETVTPIALPPDASPGLYGQQWIPWLVSYGADPADGAMLVVNDLAAGTVQVSLDGGATWTARNDIRDAITANGKYLFTVEEGISRRSSLELGMNQLTSVTFDRANPNRILLGTAESGLLYSGDHGATWGRIAESEQLSNVTSAEFLQTWIPGEALVGTWGRGLWKVSLDGVQPWTGGGMASRWPGGATNAYAAATRTTRRGDLVRARQLFAQRGPLLLIDGSMARTSRGVVPAGVPLHIAGRRWAIVSGAQPELQLRLDGAPIQPTAIAWRPGGFDLTLPPVTVRGAHVLTAIPAAGQGGKPVSLRFVVVGVEEGRGNPK